MLVDQIIELLVGNTSQNIYIDFDDIIDQLSVCIGPSSMYLTLLQFYRSAIVWTVPGTFYSFCRPPLQSHFVISTALG